MKEQMLPGAKDDRSAVLEQDAPLLKVLFTKLGEDQLAVLLTMGLHAANTVHELNNPVNALFANMQILQEYQQAIGGLWAWVQKQERTAEQEREFVRLVQDSDLAEIMDDLPELTANCNMAAARAAEILSTMRDMARGGRGKREWLDVAELFKANARLMKSLLKVSGTVSVEGSARPLFAAKGQLQQIAANLLSNALQANGGAPQDVKVQIADKEGEIVISVADEGPGLDPAREGASFVPFSSTKGEGGMGLGLFLCSRMASMLGGSLRLENRHDGRRGTVATLSVPLEAP